MKNITVNVTSPAHVYLMGGLPLVLNVLVLLLCGHAVLGRNIVITGQILILLPESKFLSCF